MPSLSIALSLDSARPPADSEIPDNAITDESGNAITDESGNAITDET